MILSGGSGTRLWPLSRPARPKQFLRLLGSNSLFQETVQRTKAIVDAAPPLVVCNEAHRFLVAEQLLELGVRAHAIVLEPVGRNTAAAVAVAALLARTAAGAGDGALLAVFPADHAISASAAFTAAIDAALEAARHGRLVTFGIVPTRPETGYGYISSGRERGRWYEIDEFVEKPDLTTAERYVASRRYLWNSGMFVFAVNTLLSELGRHAPRILEAAERALATAERDPDFVRLGDAFVSCPSDSIDYAVMEKTDKAAVVPLDAGWSDVGSWAALHDVLVKDADRNVLVGDVIASRCEDCYVSASTRVVAVLGLEGVVIVETEDAVLVMSKDEAQGVKQIAEEIAKRERR